jgi:hypothetical protein
LHRYAPFLLPFLAGFLFSNPVYAFPPPLEAGAGRSKVVDSSTFPITSLPPSFPAILFAHDGGTLTTTPPLILEVGIPTTGLEATGTDPITGTPSKITADNVTLTGTPGASTGAVVDNGEQSPSAIQSSMSPRSALPSGLGM